MSNRHCLVLTEFNKTDIKKKWMRILTHPLLSARVLNDSYSLCSEDNMYYKVTLFMITSKAPELFFT